MDVMTASKPDKSAGPAKADEARPERFEVMPSVAQHFAWLRTRFSIERTLMAWLRTSTARIGFGFTTVQVFERLHKESPDKPVMLPNSPRDFGLALIGAGVLGSIIALREYRFLVRYLWCDEFHPIAGIKGKPVNTPLVAMGILICVIGIVAFASVLFRLS